MTSFALSLGCALLAFSPTLTLLLLFAYSKAQLVIIVTTAAFAQLLSCLLSALLHLPFKALGGSGTITTLLVIIPTSVLSQLFFRCGFVWLYHKVELVIEQSIKKHEAQQELEESERDRADRSRRRNNNNSNRLLSRQENEGNDTEQTQPSGAGNANQLSETAQLRLELNDMSAGIAAGVGFGFMHTVMLYGTLLASENSRMGTLYQDSCTIMPSIFNSAIMAFFFGLLDICWMMVTFYGMRRFKRLTWNWNGASSSTGNPTFGFQFDDEGANAASSRGGISGKVALLLVVISHASAAFATMPNQIMAINGCVAALPLLGAVTALTLSGFWYMLQGSYLPLGQKQQTYHHTD